ncbi:cobyrinic acid a,c-diamide synthase [Brevirhabdus pacifica]|uniref:Hydrogenobyrinate a,c-diamide synthase n=1 Tax=Brevirhabdus pacifica TaxID=1267768 RepID=A0A1U7DKL0_9RHOB|nr:cobyrinate a,c-diamide synthase [Brevirhabdus pacifica]APX90511.1 cobyrinic acid a,c-diamide synthase [Brevirhabdus pacifica]OWU78479.1 cobyrinic acid a,c-diamide synthase [Loktanella sp. 22II-4b]PJJ85374.1 cobyrinic acid a,c-diamide synthase [Brevirhabdus pacifica]
MSVPRPRGLLLSAPASGSGKTVLSLALLRALGRDGTGVRAAKSGPDYIDPAFHAAACGTPSVNLDAWAMPVEELRQRATGQGGDLLLVEGAMGVLDAGRCGEGSAADLATALGIPVVLILDIAKQAQSAALAAAGLRALAPDLPLAGVILNRAGSDGHVAMARQGLAKAGIPVLGAVRRNPALALPERHLGLVQAGETHALEAFIEAAADIVAEGVDLAALRDAALPLTPPAGAARSFAPPGQRVAVARDTAFAFAYPHLLSDWQAEGAEILPFSPLADEGPDPRADAVFLPGGYPELHAGHLSAARGFRAGMARAAAMGARVYGECGGYMVLGETLEDAAGVLHPMLGLLPLGTSFARRRLTLGYRNLTPMSSDGAWPGPGPLKGHEFHYATITHEGEAERLFAASDATGAPLPEMGMRRDNVAGSFAHLIATAG